MLPQNNLPLLSPISIIINYDNLGYESPLNLTQNVYIYEPQSINEDEDSTGIDDGLLNSLDSYQCY